MVGGLSSHPEFVGATIATAEFKLLALGDLPGLIRTEAELFVHTATGALQLDIRDFHGCYPSVVTLLTERRFLCGLSTGLSIQDSKPNTYTHTSSLM